MLAFLAAFASFAQPPAARPAPYEDQVFYQIFPRSYRDSNGDGIGDFKGIEQGLESIQRLGCTAILINPIAKSRVYHNYFADDWMDVDPTFGTLKDFDNLISAAHARHIKIVLDMEPQYVASGHPWFIAAAQNPTGPDADLLADPVKFDPKAAPPWYNKAKVQIAAVNLNNPRVKEEIGKVFDFWSSHGVDGYRIDHMMDDLDWRGKMTNIYANLWTPLEKDIKTRYPGTFFVGEQADWEGFDSMFQMFGKTPTDACFNFRLRNAILTFKVDPIRSHLEEYSYVTRDNRVELTFLENHDMARFATEEPDQKKQRLAAALMIFAKGAPIIYYGQELGMKGHQGKFNSDGNDIPVRLAYRWGRKLDAPGTALWYKNTGPWWNSRYSSDNDGISLEEEAPRPDSLYNWYRKLIAIRQANAGLKFGTQSTVDPGDDNVLAFRRKAGSNSVLVLANLSAKGTRLKGFSGTDLLSRDKISGETNLGPWQVRAVRE